MFANIYTYLLELVLLILGNTRAIRLAVLSCSARRMTLGFTENGIT